MRIGKQLCCFSHLCYNTVSRKSTEVFSMRFNKILSVVLALTMSASLLSAARVDRKRTAPENYDEYEYTQIAAFMETEDENGVKNGTKLNEEYDVNDPATWADGWVFMPFDPPYHVMFIGWNDLDLVGQIDVSNFTMLSGLYLSSTEITSVRAANCGELGDVDISYGHVQTADFSGCGSLENIMCNQNEMTSLNVSGCTGMTTGIYCDHNLLTTLDVSDCAGMYGLHCHDNLLETLNVSNCSAMTTLNAQNNALTGIDLSDCVSLKVLNLSGNRFKNIDTSACTNLHLDSVSAVGAGTVGYWETLMGGDPLVVLYAYPDEGSEFLGWYDANDEFLSDEPEWNASASLDSIGTAVYAKFSGEPDGHKIHVIDHTNGLASADIDPEAYYGGDVTFTVSSGTDDKAVGVARINEDGSLTRLACTTAGGVHSFTVNVSDADVTLALVLKGDADLNGAVENKDGTLVKQVMVGLKTLDEETAALQIFAVDLNNDGKLQNREATMIAQTIIGGKHYAW